MHHDQVKVPIDVEGDLVEDVKKYAQERGLGLPDALSSLVRLGLLTSVRTRIVNGVHVVVLPPGSPKVTTEDVRRLRDDECDSSSALCPHSFVVF